MATVADQLLSAKEVYKIIGISEASFYRMLRQGRFPAGLRLGPATIRWRLSVVDGWINEQSN